MTDFKRARSDSQKAFRINEVKEIAEKQFETVPYQEITLSSIGEELGWSRANLYKYVSSKEEIFLMLANDALATYCNDLLTEFTNRSNLIKPEIARNWASVADENRKWFVYCSFLVSIIEKNVTLEHLKVFKKTYYDFMDELSEKLAPALGVKTENFASLFATVQYHASGLSGVCQTNPLVKQAIDELGIDRTNLNFKEEMNEFILMCLDHYCD